MLCPRPCEASKLDLSASPASNNPGMLFAGITLLPRQPNKKATMDPVVLVEMGRRGESAYGHVDGQETSALWSAARACTLL